MRASSNANQLPAVPAECGGTAAGSSQNMGDSVTPHVLMTTPGDFRFLICGIDTLDIGLYVDWGITLVEIQPQLEHLRDKAIRGNTAIWRHTVVGDAAVRPSSKRNYRYTVELPDAFLWIANHTEPNGYPNVYVSLKARSLWLNGVTQSVEGVTRLVAELGGVVQQIQVSRCDLAADFYLEEPLTTDFIKSTMVCKSRASSQYETGGQLETFYVARGKSPIQARIYNKLLQVLTKPGAAYFFALWGGPVKAWRIEFQLRRAALRQFQVNTVDDLQGRAGALWKYLTGQWLSLRLRDSTRSDRRTVHPWWQAVAGCAELFGPVFDLDRRKDKLPAVNVDWYVSHIAGCLVSFAAKLGHKSVAEAIKELDQRVIEHWEQKPWDDEYRKRRIQQGEADDGEGGCDVPF